MTLRMTRKPPTEGAEPVELMQMNQSSKTKIRALSTEQREREKAQNMAASQPAASTTQPAADEDAGAPEPETPKPAAPTTQPAAD